MYTEISACRICGNHELESVLDLGTQALTGIFPKTREQFVEAGPLEIVRCVEAGRPDACGLVQLKHSYDSAQLYGDDYGYRSGLNASMVAHLRSKAERIKTRTPLRAGDIVLDIGSNDGTMLHHMAEPGVERLGMDPTAAKFRQFYDPEVNVVPDFFSARRFQDVYGSKRARVVTSFSMFYDLESPLEFMRQVADVLSDDGVWVCEQSYLPTMLATNSYDTICHEHLEYYGVKQIQFMVERAGLVLLDVEFNDINGGSFSFVAGKPGALAESSAARALAAEESFHLGDPSTYAAFRQRVDRQRTELKSFFNEWNRNGKTIFGYGASTKGNVLLQYCGIGAETLPCIAEVNADKFGSFTPGTLIPIVDEREARAKRPDAFFVLPWHFRAFIEKKEEAFTREGALIFPLPELTVVQSPRAAAI